MSEKAFIYTKTVENYYNNAKDKRLIFNGSCIEMTDNKLYNNKDHNLELFKNADNNIKRLFLKLFIFGNTIVRKDANYYFDNNNPYNFTILFNDINDALQCFLKSQRVAVMEYRYKEHEEKRLQALWREYGTSAEDYNDEMELTTYNRW